MQVMAAGILPDIFLDTAYADLPAASRSLAGREDTEYTEKTQSHTES